MLPIDSGGTAAARRRPVAGRAGRPDSGSGEADGLIGSSVPHSGAPGGSGCAAGGRAGSYGGSVQAAPVRQLLARGDFRRLLATRLSAQFGDGVFQAALAGTVLFDPARAADPLDVAAGFAVLLLPYSLVGP